MYWPTLVIRTTLPVSRMPRRYRTGEGAARQSGGTGSSSTPGRGKAVGRRAQHRGPRYAGATAHQEVTPMETERRLRELGIELPDFGPATYYGAGYGKMK